MPPRRIFLTSWTSPVQSEPRTGECARNPGRGEMPTAEYHRARPSQREFTMFLQTRTKAAALATMGALALTGATISQAAAQDTTRAAPQAHVRLWPSSAALAHCFPHATAKVDVQLTTDAIGKDRFTIEAKGLRPRTD